MPDMTGRSRGVSHQLTNSSFQKNSMETGLSNTSLHKNSTMVQQDKQLSENRVDDTEDAELQRAIALSLQQDNSSMFKNKDVVEKIEEDDLARALAESIADIEQRSKIKESGDFQHQTSIDPNRLLRKSRYWPVGLQNVGNTCWFNVVVQSLFHLPLFRSLVLKYPSNLTNSDLSNEAQKNLQLVHELRCLFALMVASERSHVSPAKSVDLFQSAFLKQSRSSQQDVSEFIHMLLDQLEEAFRYQQRKRSLCRSSGDGDAIEKMEDACNMRHMNPMLELFYGTSMTIGVNNGNHFEQEHTFSILPLCVKNHKNLHASLDYATAKGYNPSSSGAHEVWFTRLPPVLTFQLSRFQFNQTLKKPEKIHDRLSFPTVLYMDRYMESNKNITKSKREEVQVLRLLLTEELKKLNRLQNFLCNGQYYNLPELLSTCADYAAERSIGEKSNITLPQLAPSRRRLGSNSPSDGVSPRKRSKDDEAEFSSSPKWPPSKESLDIPSSPLSDGDFSLISSLESETQLVESILRKWKVGIESQITDLKAKIREKQQAIDRIFEEPNLHNHPYSLHAVLVHKGEAMAGHYWAYILDHVNQRWLNFNDHLVMEATFEELRRESVGGDLTTSLYDNSASAYCLIYVDTKRLDLFKESDNAVINSDVMLASLVREHNQNFRMEIEKWNKKQASEKSTSNDMEVEHTSEKGVAEEHSAAWNLGDLKSAIDRVRDTYQGLGAEKALEEAVCDEVDRLKKLSEEQETVKFDPRLLSIVIYMFQNQAPTKLIERCVLEQFTDDRLKYDRRSSDIMKCASYKLNNLSPEDLQEEEYKKWKSLYQSFCTATCHYIEAMRHFHERSYFEAVRHFVAAQHHNEELLANGNKRMGLDVKSLRRYCRTCIQRVHKEAVDKISSHLEAKARDGLVMMKKKLIPCMAVLISTVKGGGTEQDLQLADSIRDEWCSLIEKDTALPREDISDALTELLDTNAFSPHGVDVVQIDKIPADLSQLYENVMTSFLQPPA